MNFKSFFQKTMTDRFNKPSHTRLSSYIILGVILLNALIFMVIDIVNLYSTVKSGGYYVIPYEHIGIYVSTLSHHLLLVGYKKNEVNELKAITDSNMSNSSDFLKEVQKNKLEE